MSRRNPPLYGTLVLFAMHAETPKAETKYLSTAQFRLVLTVMLYIHTVDPMLPSGNPFFKKKKSVAFSLSTFRNMMCCVRSQGT